MGKIYHKSLEVIYQFDTFYEDFLELSNSVSIHQSTCSFHFRKYIKALLRQPPSLCDPFSRAEKFHITEAATQRRS